MEFSYPDWSALLVQLTNAKLGGQLPHLAVSVPSPWEFYLPMIDGGLERAVAETVWSYRAPRRSEFYARTQHIGDTSGITDLNVVANGDVYPLTLMSGDKTARAGNFGNDSLVDIWNNSGVLQGLRAMKTTSLPAPCQACSIEETCGGGSRARALALTGSLQGADLLCPRIQAASGNLQ